MSCPAQAKAVLSRSNPDCEVVGFAKSDEVRSREDIPTVRSWVDSYKNERGAIPLLLLVAVIGLFGIIAMANLAPFKNQFLASLYPKDNSFAAVSGPISGPTSPTPFVSSTPKASSVASPSANTCQGIACTQGVPAGCRLEGAFTYTCDPALYSKLTCGKLVCDSPKPSATPNPYPTTPPVTGGPNLNKFTLAYCTGSVVSRIHIQWDAVTGASYYQVYRWTDASGSLVKVGETSGIAMNDETVNPGAKYYYAIKAILPNKQINGNTVSAVAPKCQYFSNTPVSGGPNFNNATAAYCMGATPRIHIQWNAVPNAVVYKILRNTNQPNSRIQIGETSGIALNDEKGTTGTQYSYTVVATVQESGKPSTFAYGNDVILTAPKCP